MVGTNTAMSLVSSSSSAAESLKSTFGLLKYFDVKVARSSLGGG